MKVDLCVESEIDEYTLAKHTSQEQLILVEREKHHLERLIMEELVRSKRIEHTVMVDSYTNKVRLKVRLRG